MSDFSRGVSGDGGDGGGREEEEEEKGAKIRTQTLSEEESTRTDVHGQTNPTCCLR